MTRPDGSRAAGFTLVEMLIALILAGLVAGGVLTLLLRQNVFYGKNDDTIYAEQTMRGTAELVASELRMVSPGVDATNTDFVLAEPDSLVVRFDVARAVVCKNLSGTIYLYAYDLPSAPNLPPGRGTAMSDRNESMFHYDPTFDATGSQATNSSSLSYTYCLAANGGVPQSTDLDRYRTVNWSNATDTYFQNNPPDSGAVVRMYGTLTYSFGPSSFTSGTALWRNGQELVAPFASGASFEYVMADGSVLSSVSSVNFPNIRRIRISATATGSGSNRYDVSRDLSFDIAVRNL